jgi:hypothetical protein
MNRGGFSRISRQTGISLTRPVRQRKLGSARIAEIVFEV